MDLKSKLTTKILLVLAFLLGILCDKLIVNWPYLKVDSQINILDLATLILTLVITILVPTYFSKIIQDKHEIKTCLIEELKLILTDLVTIRDSLSRAYTKKKITSKEKRFIIATFEQAELKMQSFKDQINISFNKEAGVIFDKLEDLYFDYERSIAGGEFMMKEFKIDYAFLHASSKKYSHTDSGIKILIHTILQF